MDQDSTGPVDFGIVTALPIERDAVLRHLGSYHPVRFDSDPVTYYRGSVTIAATGETYSVVAIMLVEPGNDSAAAATTSLIRRWQPKHVLMVGIAGGVPGKVSLGDVAIADYSFYYEPAKMTPSGEQPRPEQFHSNRMLYARAQAYTAVDWRNSIGTARPGAQADNLVLSKVHFGPIASGEKVIADESFMTRLRAECSKLVATAMEGAGVARAAEMTHPPAGFLEIRGICDLADSNKNDDWQPYAADVAAAFTFGFLKDRPIGPIGGSGPDSGKVLPPLVVLVAQSLRKIPQFELADVLADVYPNREIRWTPLDFTDLVVDGRIRDVEAATQRLLDMCGNQLASQIEPGASLVFGGLVHIPLAILAGYFVTDRQPVGLFDFHPEDNSWNWQSGDGVPPELGITGIPDKPLTQSGEVVVRVSVSYEVKPIETRAVVPNAALEVDLQIPAPTRSIVRTEDQAREYGRVFRKAMDLIVQRLPAATRVHLFYAGPVSLAFHIGQQVSGNIHPPVIAWNYRRQYEWAIDLSLVGSGRDAIIRAPGVE